MTAAAIRRPQSRVVTLRDGRRVHARVWAGRGLPLVLLHGLLDSAEGWEELCRATPRPCVAIDLAGFGCSDLPAHPALSGYAEDVVEALRELVPGSFVLVGHSLGGGVATAVAERLGTRVRALVLLAPAGFGRIALAELVSVPGVRQVSERVMPFALGSRLAIAVAYRTMVANGLDASDDIIDRVVEHEGPLVRAAVAGTKAVVRAGLSKRAFHRRRVGFDQPVVVVWGDRDRLVPLAHLEGVRTAFPHAQTHVWEGMGHHPKRERPAQLAELVEATARAVTRSGRVPRVAAA